MVGAIALLLCSTGCASSPGAPKPFPLPSSPAGRQPVPGATDAAEPSLQPDLAGTPDTGALVVRTALGLRGVPYRNGGSDPRGFDCSGFTQWVFAQAGTALPRETREQFLLGTLVSEGAQQPGDLLFFTTIAPGASHVGIALGGDAFVHAPSSSGVVRVESLTLPYWSRRLVGIRRVAPR
ncbi:MAG TPA: C40 family peptidase [Vicinamibacterales bacterium]|nr:C40 family peptidase [Vicinamibacterales bacterium]